MSPEQVRGKAIDGRTDVFSLGATFFEMLTGRRAFVRDSPVETLGAVLRDDPRRYPEVEKIPDDIKGFVFRCLEKDPADRYQSARDLLLDLRAYQAEQLRQIRRARHVPVGASLEAAADARGDAGLSAARSCSPSASAAGSCWERARATSRPPSASSARLIVTRQTDAVSTPWAERAGVTEAYAEARLESRSAPSTGRPVWAFGLGIGAWQQASWHAS